MKIQITTNSVRIRLIRKIKKENKSFRKVRNGWYEVIQDNKVVEVYEDLKSFASTYDVVKPFEEIKNND